MKILLPSIGLLGQRSVTVKVPTFADIYKIQDFKGDDFVQKVEFLKLISNMEFDKVTMCDMEYVFQLIAFALLNNTVIYDFTCKNKDCKRKYKQAIQLLDQEIVQLKIKARHLPFSKRIYGKKYTYTIPSVSQVMEAYELAQYEEDEERAFTDLQVALIMGHPCDRKYAQQLPVSVYAAALVFQEVNFHGIKNEFTTKCPECGKINTYAFKVTSNVLNFDKEAIMSKYVNACESLSFIDFMEMSIRGFNDFVSALNKKVNG